MDERLRILGAGIYGNLKRSLIVSNSGIYIKNDWTKYADSKMFVESVGSGSETFLRKPRPETYQTWLDYYYMFVESRCHLGDPLLLTIEMARREFKKRPLWAITYSAKGFDRESLLDTMVDIKLESSDYYWTERELILDNHKTPVLIERLLDCGGLLKRLGVYRSVGGEYNVPYFRDEKWVAKSTFYSKTRYLTDEKYKYYKPFDLLECRRPIHEELGFANR